MGSLVDPSYELIDPTPDIFALFKDFNSRFFDGKLAGCELKWSPRMTTCAGVCSYEGRGGLCSIRLSTPLLKLRPRKDLVETLLHEMIHAFLFFTARNRDRDGHGPEFQYHMHRINNESGTNITIYHSFHREVALYKQHHWRCVGSCRDRRPFFGWVKRASNRAPGPNDLWWDSHKRDCGGHFEKVHEPEGFKEKKKRGQGYNGKNKKDQNIGGSNGHNQPRIDNIFKNISNEIDDTTNKKREMDKCNGSGSTLGGSSNGMSRLIQDNSSVKGESTLGGNGGGRSRLLNLFDDQSSKRRHVDVIVLEMREAPPSVNQKVDKDEDDKNLNEEEDEGIGYEGGGLDDSILTSHGQQDIKKTEKEELKEDDDDQLVKNVTIRRRKTARNRMDSSDDDDEYVEEKAPNVPKSTAPRLETTRSVSRGKTVAETIAKEIADADLESKWELGTTVHIIQQNVYKKSKMEFSDWLKMTTEQREAMRGEEKFAIVGRYRVWKRKDGGDIKKEVKEKTNADEDSILDDKGKKKLKESLQREPKEEKKDDVYQLNQMSDDDMSF